MVYNNINQYRLICSNGGKEMGVIFLAVIIGLIIAWGFLARQMANVAAMKGNSCMGLVLLAWNNRLYLCIESAR